MSLVNYIGKRGNILDINSSDYSNCIKVNQPILKEKDLNKIISFADSNEQNLKVKELDITFKKNNNEKSLLNKINDLSEEAEKNVQDGANILILTDKNISEENISVPALLAVSVVHHHLIKGLRTSTGLVLKLQKREKFIIFV